MCLLQEGTKYENMNAFVTGNNSGHLTKINILRQ